MAAIVVRNLGLDVGKRKAVVFRVDHPNLPHLTFSWENLSGEIDVHLTPAAASDYSTRQSILRIQESEFKVRLASLIRECLELVSQSPIQIVWGVQAKWLVSHGYVLIGPKSEPVRMWLQRALPKERGKYRLDERVLQRMPKMDFYNPTVRRMTGLAGDDQVYAVCTKGRERGRMLALQRMSCGPVSTTWVGLDVADIAALVQVVKRKKILPNWFASMAPGAWNRISRALRLGEIGL